MTNAQRTVERIKSANAVPSMDSFPPGALSSSALRHRIDERKMAMSSNLIYETETELPGPPTKRRGPLVALAVAAAILVVVGIAAISTSSRNDLTPVDQPAITTPVVPAPAERDARALPADTPLLEVVATFQERSDRGDVEGFEALFHPENGYVRGSNAEGSWFAAATGITTQRNCVALPTTQISCTERATSGLDPTVTTSEYTTLWTGAEGYIYTVEFPDGFPEPALGDPVDGPGVPEYRDWLEARFPDAFPDLFSNGSAIKVDTEDARTEHQRFIAMYLASIGPRSELALPADMPLADVVSVFRQRFAAGDVEGYEAIFHPSAGYESGSDAEAAWFSEITGAATEVDCNVVTYTQLRCTERSMPGLVPGTISDPFETIWNGADGYIWSIEFSEGTPSGFDLINGPGVAAYRQWVETNAPDQFDELFSNGGKVNLLTADLRATHAALVTDYLASISGG